MKRLLLLVLAAYPALAQGWDWQRDAGLPAWMPPPVVPADNPMSLAEPEIGYHDTGVSRRGGIGEVIGEPIRAGAVRTPSLRNVALTAPYMHDGSIPALERVLEHYAKGGHNRGPVTSVLLRGFRLSKQERANVITFLNSLTDRELTTDSRWADPWPQMPAR